MTFLGQSCRLRRLSTTAVGRRLAFSFCYVLFISETLITAFCSAHLSSLSDLLISGGMKRTTPLLQQLLSFHHALDGCRSLRVHGLQPALKLLPWRDLLTAHADDPG